MLEPRGDVNLAQEALGAQAGGQLGAQHLEGDLPLMAEVVGEVHRGHAAPPELLQERVAVAQGVSKLRVDSGHRAAWRA